MENINKEKRTKNILSKKYIHEFNVENDIKFRGPLSYRHLRIIAWVFLVISQIGVVLTFGRTINSNPDLYGVWPNILNFFFSFMAPLFLIASFSVVLNAKDGYRKLLISYSGLAAIIYFIFVIIYQHYFVGFMNAFAPGEGDNLVATIIDALSKQGFLSFNIFIDLLLCTLITFFINYRPKKYFQDKKIYIFRSLVILPILYELGSITLKVLASNDIIYLSAFVYPLLTTKAPMAFLIFVSMAVFIKNREKHFLKNGKTHEDYLAFQNTNVNSLQFSARLGLTIFLAVIFDFVFTFLLIIAFTFFSSIPEGVDVTTFMLFQLEKINSWGFGQTLPLLIIIPLVLLFDYKKTHKNEMVDIFIPVAGIIAIGIVYLEGGFEILRNFLIERSNSSNDNQENNQQLINIIKIIK